MIQKILQSFDEIFPEKSDIKLNRKNLRESIKSFIISVFIQDIDEEMERLKLLEKNCGFQNSSNKNLDAVFFKYEIGYNQALKDQIDHLEAKKKELLELMMEKYIKDWSEKAERLHNGLPPDY